MSKLNKSRLIAAAAGCGMLAAAAASPLPELTAEKRQSHLEELFRHLDSARFGTEYAAALRNSDMQTLIRTVARYFRERPQDPGSAETGRGYNADRAERAVRGEMMEVNIPWTFPEGRIRYLFDPTAIRGPVNHEWLWQLNRHSFWNDMANAYAATGDEKYARAFNIQLRDWIAQTDCPPNWNAPGSAWRTIEAGLRLMGSWPVAFDRFRHSPEFTDENLCLMLASMHRQAVHLLEHPTGGNWLLMEMNGVYTFATLFPEFSDAEAFRRKSARTLSDALRGQILPDGMHDELSPDYHSVVFTCGSQMFRLAQLHHRTEELPPDFAPLLEKAAEAYLALATPGFTQPRTNDCFTLRTDALLGKASRLFPERRDFQWGASRRAAGIPPQGETASRFLPWAGFAAMRSDWGPEATYLCFDVGSLGMGHQHQDKLNINLYLGDEELIFDDGGGQYEESAARRYGISAADHNTILVDGKPQNRRGPKKLEEPVDAGWVSTQEFDYARGSYDAEFGQDRPAVHRREVRFCKPDFFCVVDSLTPRDNAAHDYELLFHLDTLKTVAVPEFPGAVKSNFGRKYDVLIVPLFPEELTVSTASGQTEPRMAGWYVGRNEARLHPATTVTMKAAGKREFRFATLLFPLRQNDELPVVKRLSEKQFRITFRGREQTLDLDRLNTATEQVGADARPAGEKR